MEIILDLRLYRVNLSLNYQLNAITNANSVEKVTDSVVSRVGDF